MDSRVIRGQTNNVGIQFDASKLYHNINIIVNDSDYISVMTGYFCVLNYSRKVSPLEGSKNRDSLLKKLVCVCVYVGGTRCGWMCIHVCVGGWVCSVSLTLYMRKMPKGIINLHALNDERRLKASWIRLSVITAQGEWLQALYPVCG